MTDVEIANDVPEHCLGTTGPLNLSSPSESDIKITKELEAALTGLNVFETPDEMALRRESLLQLQDMCNNWIHAKAVEKKFPPHMASNYAGKVYTFGSYRLGVNTRGADIDALLVVPRFIERSEFFDDFYQVLRESPNVEDLHPVPDAYVPVMKMIFCGVEIDLLFAKVDLLTIPSDFDLCEKTEQLLRNMSDQDVRSVNGVRVTEEVLRLVHNKETFKTSLKVIRMWAKKRGLYSNALGFLGGVSWAILVARICQLFPKAAPCTIVIQFFNVLRQWEWPRPIMLKHTETSSLGFPVWDPRININDQFHLMPILTPAYPSQNSTYNVSNSSKTVIVREINNAAPLIKDIMTKKKSWNALFEEANFFAYRHYVVVMVTAPEKQQFMELCGLVESKMRILVANFERSPMVELAHVYCRSFGRAAESDPEFLRKWFIGMQFRKTAIKMLNVDLSNDIHIFEKSIGRGLQNENMCDFVTVKHVKKSQLVDYLPKEELEKVLAAQPVRVNRKRASDSNLVPSNGATPPVEDDSTDPISDIKRSRVGEEDSEMQDNKPEVTPNGDTYIPHSELDTKNSISDDKDTQPRSDSPSMKELISTSQTVISESKNSPESDSTSAHPSQSHDIQNPNPNTPTDFVFPLSTCSSSVSLAVADDDAISSENSSLTPVLQVERKCTDASNSEKVQGSASQNLGAT